jgi:DNA-binding CsgD family transcriptional regulator
MEDNKSGCEEIIAELNEYKELLWQLSDEYKENVTAAEKKVESEIEKRQKLEKELKELHEKITLQGEDEGDGLITEGIDINLLGLPACVLDKEGNLLKFNNKFKFFIELLSFEIEDINSLHQFADKINNPKLSKTLLNYFQSDKNVFQDIFSTVNSFQKQVYIVLRIYRNVHTNEQLALWIELQKDELDSILPVAVAQNIEYKTESETVHSKEDTLIADIQSYAKRYEISSQLLSFINKKINKKAENIALIREIYNKIEKTFNLKKEAVDLLKRIETRDKDFIKRLSKKFTDLTANEQKHCLLIRQGLTYKEIAALMEISVNGVKIARNRLRKKLQLNGDTKTSEFIMKI